MITTKDLINKELVKSLIYTNQKDASEACVSTVINGREYLKFGKLQTVTIVGHVYKTYNSKTGCVEYWLNAGMSKQHPTDITNDKKLAVELASERAFMDPFMVVQVPKNFGEISFRDMMRIYVNDMDLDFVMTTEEKNNSIQKNWFLD